MTGWNVKRLRREPILGITPFVCCTSNWDDEVLAIDRRAIEGGLLASMCGSYLLFIDYLRYGRDMRWKSGNIV